MKRLRRKKRVKKETRQFSENVPMLPFQELWDMRKWDKTSMKLKCNAYKVRGHILKMFLKSTHLNKYIKEMNM